MPKSKIIRDKNAPRRNLTPFILFQNAKRAQVKAQHPDYSIGQVAKVTSQMYASLAPQEKEFWQQKAVEDKARYIDEMSRYIPPPGFDNKGESINSKHPNQYSLHHNNKVNKNVHQGRTKVKTVKCKDANAPKRNLSAYLLFQNAMREQYKAANPGMTFGQLSTYTASMYKSLSPEERALWDERCEQDKERYEEEMQSYIPPPGFDRFGVKIDNTPATMQAKKSSRKVLDPNMPKRPRGSYVFFTNYIRPIILKESPGIQFKEVGKRMGERWRNLDPEVKKKFENMASEDKIRFNKEMEAYDAKKMEAASVESFTLAQKPMAQPNQVYYQNGIVQNQQQQQYYNHYPQYGQLNGANGLNSNAFQHLRGHQDQMQGYEQLDQYLPNSENPFGKMSGV